MVPYGRKFSRDPILRKAHHQRVCDLIFADGRSRVAPPTISVRLRLAPLTARAPRLMIRTGRKSCEKPASDRPIVLVLSRDQEMAQESHMIKAMVRGAICVEAQQQWTSVK